MDAHISNFKSSVTNNYTRSEKELNLPPLQEKILNLSKNISTLVKDNDFYQLRSQALNLKGDLSNGRLRLEHLDKNLEAILSNKALPAEKRQELENLRREIEGCKTGFAEHYKNIEDLALQALKGKDSPKGVANNLGAEIVVTQYFLLNSNKINELETKVMQGISSFYDAKLDSLKQNATPKQSRVKTGLEYLEEQRDPVLLRQGEYEKGREVGQLEIRGAKKVGVEPGFRGGKRWIDIMGQNNKLTNTQKLDEPSHPFFHLAIDWLKTELPKIHPEKMAQIYHEIQNPNVVMSKMLKEADLLSEVQAYVKEKSPKFQKTHYVKMLYKSLIPTRSRMPDGSRKVTVSLLGTLKKFHLAGPIYFIWKTTDQAKLNMDSIKECLANAAYIQGGCPGQGLELLPSRNPEDGHLNFLLDGTEVRGPQNELCSTFEGQIQEGFLDKNRAAVFVDEAKTAVKLVPFNENELANLAWLTKIYGDRDKVGSAGKNLCFYAEKTDATAPRQAKLMNIDPGKAFSEWMGKARITTDGRLQQADAKVFKNLTALEDTTLLTRLKAFNAVYEQKNQILTLFEKYKTFYGSQKYIDLCLKAAKENAKELGQELSPQEINQVKDLANKEAKTYIANLDATKSKLNKTFEDFKGILENRLEWLATEGEGAINLLDNLEKLTSTTISNARAVHLHVDPNSRREWYLEKQKNGTYLLFTQAPTTKEAARIQERLSQFSTSQTNGTRVEIRLNSKAELDALSKVMTEDAVKTFKAKQF